MRRSGSKRLFLSSEFPGSRLAAIPGTGVTFPAEPTEQGERGGGPCALTRTHTHSHALLHMQICKPHMWTPTLTRARCAGMLTPPFLFSNPQTNVMHTHGQIYRHTNTHLHVHVYARKALPKIMNSDETRTHSLVCTSCSKLCRTLSCMNTQTHSWKF